MVLRTGNSFSAGFEIPFTGDVSAGSWAQSTRPHACGRDVKLLASSAPLAAIFGLRSPCRKGIVCGTTCEPAC